MRFNLAIRAWKPPFAVCSILLKFIFNNFYSPQIFFLGIFYVQNFVFRMIAAHAAKAVVRIKNIFAILKILAVPAYIAEI